MSTLVDTPVWSEFLRRSSPDTILTNALANLILVGQAHIIGPIRQEVLSGIKQPKHFASIRTGLEPFPDLEIVTSDYEEAAGLTNLCRSVGIQGSSTDFLICAVSIRFGISIFTPDRDFLRYAEHLPIRLFDASEGG